MLLPHQMSYRTWTLLLISQISNFGKMLSHKQDLNLRPSAYCPNIAVVQPPCPFSVLDRSCHPWQMSAIDCSRSSKMYSDTLASSLTRGQRSVRGHLTGTSPQMQKSQKNKYVVLTKIRTSHHKLPWPPNTSTAATGLVFVMSTATQDNRFVFDIQRK